MDNKQVYTKYDYSIVHHIATVIITQYSRAGTTYLHKRYLELKGLSKEPHGTLTGQAVDKL